MQRGVRGQIGIEYLIIAGFVIFLVFSVLGVALYYSSGIHDSLTYSYISRFASSLISSSESVFYAGEPSKSTFDLYLPAEVRRITINGTRIYFYYLTSDGSNNVSFTSKVSLQGNLSINEGTKHISVTAASDHVDILEH